MDFEAIVLDHYTANGGTQIAVIPQFAIPPDETWSIDLVGIDLKNRSILFIEISSAQTPSAGLINKIQRRAEWIPVARGVLGAGASPIDEKWKETVVVFVIDSRVEWMRRKLGDLSGVIVAPLSQCLPSWISGKEPERGQPRLALG